ncbi:polysaccharide deacetylase family protein [Rhodococcus jostii]|uniref:Polysaccharide deacetylase n=1 Tax=Rhodococcus jostii TaxID=132919 RepID=A0A1H4IN26_RHOJO|nr:polysaccharide deacetylase [Rhodococcus jostii]SEB35494.1 Polysaccharide deacetylase [Rhodococcus jostii]
MPLQLPAGKKIAVNIGADFDAHSCWMGTFGLTSPGVLSRGDFDAEVGVPRLLDALRRYEVLGNFFTPGHTMETFPEVFQSVLDAGHEISAHGCWHEPIMKLEPAQERDLFEKALAQHEKYVGFVPRGYRSPAWDFTDTTLSLIEEYGLDWDSSLMGRDLEPYHPRPTEVRYEEGNRRGEPSPILEFPVSWYLDDFPAVEHIPGVNAGMQSPEVIYQRWKDHFDFAYQRVPNGLVTITVHPQSIGRPHNLMMFERLLDYMTSFDDVLFTNLSTLYDLWSEDETAPTSASASSQQL